MNFDLYKYRLEAHAHTFPVSPCSEFSPEKLIDIYEALNYDSIVITNHFSLLSFKKLTDKTLSNYILDYKKAVEYAKDKNISVILGMEIRFPENANDYLVYGIDEAFVEKAYTYLDSTLEKFYTEMKNDKNVILQAHPFRDGIVPMSYLFLDGIEIFNMHPGHNSRNSFASKLALSNPKKLVCGGTDCHHPTHEGGISINTKEKITDSFMFADVLKSKDFIFDISGNKIIPHNFKK